MRWLAWDMHENSMEIKDYKANRTLVHSAFPKLKKREKHWFHKQLQQPRIIKKNHQVKVHMIRAPALGMIQKQNKKVFTFLSHFIWSQIILSHFLYFDCEYIFWLAVHFCFCLKCNFSYLKHIFALHHFVFLLFAVSYAIFKGDCSFHETERHPDTCLWLVTKNDEEKIAKLRQNKTGNCHKCLTARIWPSRVFSLFCSKSFRMRLHST